jgi:hypothetical protein
MSTYTESQLRTMLADNLTLIEPGLQLDQEEFHLKNAHGTRGFIDLLARDRHGMYVVIELKRDKSAAREALHEVVKYTRLLVQERGISRKKIRAIIVSTTWDELLTPFSDFAGSQEYDVRGYQLVFDATGALAPAERVALLPDPPEQRLTPIHFQYFFRCAQDRENGWEKILRSVRAVGAEHFVGVDLDFTGTEGVVGPYSLYVAFGTIEAGDPADGSTSQSDESDWEDEVYARYPREYQALCHLTSTVFYPGSESATPEKFASIEIHRLWEVR